jgi:transcriptional regulator with XRE-family HTH domain
LHEIIYARKIFFMREESKMDSLDIGLFGKRLRELRRERTLSQQDLAKRMGVAQGWISELENGRQTRIEAETVYRFCRALGCTSDYLFGLTDDPRPRPRRKRAPAAATGDDAEEAA